MRDVKWWWVEGVDRRQQRLEAAVVLLVTVILVGLIFVGLHL